MSDTITQPKRRRMSRESQVSAASTSETSKAPSRLDLLERLLTEEGGTTITDMVEATGWQQHSVRGAMAGALKRRSLLIKSAKLDGVRRYRAERVA